MTQLRPRALISSAVMMVMIAGASWTVVTPLAAEVTTLARSISRSTSSAISGSPSSPLVGGRLRHRLGQRDVLRAARSSPIAKSAGGDDEAMQQFAVSSSTAPR